LVIFAGDSLTHMALDPTTKAEGYKKYLLSKLTTQFPEHAFIERDVGFPGARTYHLKIDLDKKIKEGRFWPECQAVIVPYLIGINDLMDKTTTFGVGAGDEDKRENATTIVKTSWDDVRDYIAGKIDATYPRNDKLFLAMTIPSADGRWPRGVHPPEPLHIKLNMLIDLFNKAIEPAHSLGTTWTYEKVLIGKDLTVTSIVNGMSITYLYHRVPPGHTTDGLHFAEEANKHIAQQVFDKTKPWIETH